MVCEVVVEREENQRLLVRCIVVLYPAGMGVVRVVVVAGGGDGEYGSLPRDEDILRSTSTRIRSRVVILQDTQYYA